jgi:hypothetical protein
MGTGKNGTKTFAEAMSTKLASTTRMASESAVAPRDAISEGESAVVEVSVCMKKSPGE